MLYTGLLVRPLRRDPGRTLLTILAVALGIAVVVAIRMANRSALQSFQQTTSALAGRADLIATGPVPIPADLLPRLDALGGQAEISPYLDRMSLDARSGEMLEVFGVDLLGNAAHRSDLRAAGAQTIQPKPGTLPIVLTEAYARRFGNQVGHRLWLSLNGRERPFTVVALLPDQGVARAQSGNVALLDLPEALQVFEFPDKPVQGFVGTGWLSEPEFPLGQVRFDGLQIVLAPGVSAQALQTSLQPLLPAGDRVEPPAARAQQSDRMLAAFRSNLDALSYISLLVGVFLIYNTVSMAVVRRRTEVATVRALGATRGAVLRVFFAESLLFSLAGGVLGIALGWVMAGATLRLISLTINNLYAVQHPGPARLQPMDALWVLGLALLTGIVSSLAPALEAASVAPAEGTRPGAQETAWHGRRRLFLVLAAVLALLAAVLARLPEPVAAPVFGYGSALATVLACALAVPPLLSTLLPRLRSLLLRRGWVSSGLAAASLAGSLRRTSVLLIALSTAVAMMVSVAVMVGSFRDTVQVWVENRLQADVFVRALDWTRNSPAGLDPALVHLVESTPGVRSIVEYHSQPLLFRGQRTFLTVHWQRDPATGQTRPVQDAAVTNFHFLSGGSPQQMVRRLEQGDVLVSEPFARRFRLTVGDRIELPTPTGFHSVELAGIYYDYASSEGEVEVSLRQYRQWFGEPAVTSTALYARPGLASAALRQRVQRRVAAAAGGRVQLAINDNASLRGEVLKIFDQTFRITWGLELIALVVAILGVANTLLAVALERRRELAILRFLGSTSAQTRRMLLAESGLIGLLAVLVGSAMGAILAIILIDVINVQSFGWTIQIHIPWLFLLLACLLVFLATLAAGWGPARVACKLDPLRAVAAG